MDRLAVLLVLLGLSSSVWGCAQIRPSGNSVEESAGFIEVCAEFTEPAAVGGILTLFSSISGEASSPEDFMNVSVNFTVAVNMTDDLCVNITILEDSIFEDTEQFTVDLTSETVDLCAISFAFVQIIDTTTLNVRFSPTTIASTNEQGFLDVCVEMDVIPSPFMFERDVEFTLEVVPGLGTAESSDFTFTTPLQSFNSPTVTMLCGQVGIGDDTFIESDETFLVTLTSTDTIVLLGGPALVSLTDDDGASVSFTSTAMSVPEGDAGSTDVQFCLQLDSNAVLERDVNIVVNTMSGTASPGDFEPLTNVILTIPAGSSPPFQVCSSVAVFGDNDQEGNEQFTVVATVEDTDDVITNSPFTVTILDDDDADNMPNMMNTGGDPHFSVLLPSGQLICYSIQGEHGFTFNLISNNLMQVNALFIPDAVREEVTWIGALGITVKGSKYKAANDTQLRFVADERKIYLGDRAKLDAKGVRKIRLAKGKLTLVENEKKHSQVEVDVELADVGLEFSVRFVKGTHLDMFWKKVRKQAHSHGLIGQFLRDKVQVDEARRLLLLPTMDPVPVMRKSVWHYMERDTPDDQFCWVTMNPGYQGKRLIEGSYLDYLVNDVLSSDFSFKK